MLRITRCCATCAWVDRTKPESNAGICISVVPACATRSVITIERPDQFGLRCSAWRDQTAQEPDDLQIYKEAMESMAAQFLHPKMTALEMAKMQLGRK